MEGEKRVPQRIPRTIRALIAVCTAVVFGCISVMPSSADAVRNSEWWLSTMHISTAYLVSRGSGVTVAMLSDGVDTSHPDLAGAVTEAPAPAGAPKATGRFFGEQGTGIASLIAGRGHRRLSSGLTGEGILGAAPQAHILSIPVTLPADDPQLNNAAVARSIPKAIAAGIQYAVSHNATVIDLPIDPGQPSANGTRGSAAAAGGSPAEEAAVKSAISHGVVLVAPAGDDGSTTDAPNFPAAYPGVIAVGAFNKAFVKAPFSSHQRYVTVTAAGEGVTAAANNGSYQTMNSTSAASALVAGIVAQIRSRYPSLGVSAIRKALITSTQFGRRNGLQNGSGYGTVDAAKAMAAAAAMATPVSLRAGAHAQPLVRPSAVAASSTGNGMARGLIKDGAISAGLLVVLLLLISFYVLTGRRRGRRQRPPGTTEWASRPGQSRYPQARPDPDDPYGYLSTPPGASGNTTALSAGAHDRSPFSAAGGPVQPSFGQPRVSGEGSATNAVSRRPPVSGAPPWEPASLPDADMPWEGASSLAPEDGQSAEPPLAGIPADPMASSPEPRPGWSAWGGDSTWGADTALPAGDMAGGNLPARRIGPAAANLQPNGPAGVNQGRPARPSKLAPWDAARTGEQDSPGGWGAAAERARPADRPRPADPRLADPPRLLDRPPADWRSSGTWPSPTGTNPGTAAPASPSGEQPPPRVTASGLPVRQPRSVPTGPPSPSGSLWEPAASRARDSRPGSHARPDQRADRAPGAAAEHDSAGRPIYVWDPSAGTDAYNVPPE